MPLLDAVEAVHGERPATVLTNAGYCNEADLVKLEARGVDGHVALGQIRLQTCRRRSRRPHRTADAGTFTGNPARPPVTQAGKRPAAGVARGAGRAGLLGTRQATCKDRGTARPHPPVKRKLPGLDADFPVPAHRTKE